VFIVMHLSMIFFWSWGQLNASMIFGSVRNTYWATALSLVIIAAIAPHVAATVWSRRRPAQVRRVLGAVVTRARLILLRPLNSRQNYPARKLSKEHRVNGKSPTAVGYKVMAVHNFVDWRLRVGGLVEQPVTLDLSALRARAEPETQRVMHKCVQGWTSIGEWSGMHLSRLAELVRPLPQARYICFLTMQGNSTDEPSSEGGGQFYEVMDPVRGRPREQTLPPAGGSNCPGSGSNCPRRGQQQPWPHWLHGRPTRHPRDHPTPG
jgi:methionine sulfoxide reductase catalytic subunit